MSKSAQISGKNLCKILEKDGFIFVRQTGSHKIYQKQTEDVAITIPVPFHSNRPLLGLRQLYCPARNHTHTMLLRLQARGEAKASHYLKSNTASLTLKFLYIKDR